MLGLGNPILIDDGVGIYVIRGMTTHCQRNDVTFAEASVGGLRLLDVISGHERVIMMDAIQTRDDQPGDTHRLHPNDLRASLHLGSTHDLSLLSALALGRGKGLVLSDDESLVIIAIEVEDVLTFGEAYTSTVTAPPPVPWRPCWLSWRRGSSSARNQ